jgi:mycothiol synthase
MTDLELVVAEARDGPRMAAVRQFLQRLSGPGDDLPLSEHKRMELARHPAESDPSGADPSASGSPVPDDRFVGVLALRRSTGDMVGYAQVSIGPGSGQFAVESAVDPGIDRSGADRADGGSGDEVADALLVAAIDWVRSAGGGTLRLWVSKASGADDERALAHGFGVERNLIQMRCPLPLPPPAPALPSGDAVAVRPFRVGNDESAWLATNNRAFASHPEQGHWELATLLEREREPWFDPNGFLILDVVGRVAASCWTKVHARADPPMGEIYVISVDPDFHGRGWGRALTRAGLDWLADQGLTVGMLYVDADNVAATTMYRSMGFVDHHVDRAYLLTVPPA